LIHQKDYQYTAPTADQYYNTTFSSADTSGTSQDPYIEITTSTSYEVYPDPSPESSSVDGDTYGTSSSKATARSTGTGASDTGTRLRIGAYFQDPTYIVYRAWLLFDTSPIGATQNVDKVLFTVVPNGVAGYSLELRSATTASNTAIATGDHNGWGATALTDEAIAWGGTDNNVRTAYTLNASGRSNINRTGVSKFSIVTQADATDGTFPTSSVSDYVNSADATGTANDPFVIVYTSPAGPSGVSTYNSLTSASITSCNTMAWGSISSIL
jgi:hypothetical protein